MNARPAIVIVTSSFPIRGDGSEAAGSFVRDVALEVSRHAPVRVVAPGNEAGVECWVEGIEVHRFPAPRVALSALRLWWPPDVLKAFRVMSAGREAVRRAVHAGPAGHILALWALPCGEWARSVSSESGVPYSVWALGSDIWSLGRIPLVRLRLRHVLERAHACFADGMALAKDTLRLASREVEFLPSTRRIELRRTDPARGAPPYRLVYVGRWHRNKGTDLLLKALIGLHDDDWRSIESVAIHGGGPLEESIRKLASRLKADGRPVELGGYLAKADAEQAIMQADYLVIPSRKESIPVVLSDALKLRCPVICTPVGDMAQIVGQGRVGIVAGGASEQQIRQAIREAISGRHRFDPQALDQAAAVFDERRIAVRIVELLGDC